MHPSASWRGELKQHGAVFGGVLIHQLMTHYGRQQNLQPGEISCSEEGAHSTNADSGDCEVAGDLGSEIKKLAVRPVYDDRCIAAVSGQQVVQPGPHAVTGISWPSRHIFA